MIPRVTLTLDRQALLHNLAVARTAAGSASLTAVVKSDAYGHGADPVACWLAPHVDCLAVATVDEGLALRRLGIDCPVLVLSDFVTEDLDRVLEHALQPVIHGAAQLEVAESLLSRQGELTLKFDSGMARLGFSLEDLPELLERFRSHPHFDRIVLMSHLANADDLDDPASLKQIETFDQATRVSGLRRSLANSAGLLGWPGSRFEHVRPGVALYGASPLRQKSARELGLQAVMTLSTRVLAVRELPAGQRVGYGGRWQPAQPARIALLACGYGDGYPRHARDGTPVGINGFTAPLAGCVSMDTLAVDVTDAGHVTVDQEAVLWGATPAVDEVAAHAGTIAYELFCRLTRRVHRHEHGDR